MRATREQKTTFVEDGHALGTDDRGQALLGVAPGGSDSTGDLGGRRTAAHPMLESGGDQRALVTVHERETRDVRRWTVRLEYRTCVGHKLPVARAFC